MNLERNWQNSVKTTISNPVLPGFNPDPSFLRVGDDFYLATSTFEWFPGVPLYHSRDLANWRLVGHALDETRLLDLKGVPDSGGIWAPSLSYHDGQFWLVYTVVRYFGMGKPFKDHHNYLTNAPTIEGPWSDPIFLHSAGFDAALFHDADGKKYLASIQWDFRPGKPRFGGIVLQEYDPNAQKLVGKLQTIATNAELIEGPNLYWRDGFYYLMLAQGGTGSNHGISMLRSRSIWGPYENDPQYSVLMTRDDTAMPMQQAGHGELVETASGEWFLAHLFTRPQRDEKGAPCGSVLGRETGLQRVIWNAEGWLRLENGGHHPQLEIMGPQGMEPHVWPAEPTQDDFEAPVLSSHWQSLRVPTTPDWANLSERNGWLRLRGRESLWSQFEQSLLAKRLLSTKARVETCLDFSPTHWTQSAGLIGYFSLINHAYLRATWDAERGKVLGVVLTDNGTYREEESIEVNDWPLLFLRAELNGDNLQFWAARGAEKWQEIGPKIALRMLSDGYASRLDFTGTLFGVCAQDLNGSRCVADFDCFSLEHYED